MNIVYYFGPNFVSRASQNQVTTKLTVTRENSLVWSAPVPSASEDGQTTFEATAHKSYE